MEQNFGHREIQEELDRGADHGGSVGGKVVVPAQLFDKQILERRFLCPKKTKSHPAGWRDGRALGLFDRDALVFGQLLHTSLPSSVFLE